MPEHADDPVRSGDFVLVAELAPSLAAAAVRMLRGEGVRAYAGAAANAADRAELAELAELAESSIVAIADALGPGALFVPRPAAATARRLLDERLPGMQADMQQPLPEPLADEPPTAGDVQDGTARPAGDAGELGSHDMTSSEFSAGGLGAAGIPDEAAGIPDEKVDEAVWAELVAAFEGPSADVSGRRLPPFAGTSEAPARAASGEGGRPLESARPEAATSDVDDDFPEEHFEPDPPPPLPRLGWLMGTAWLAVLGTPVLFLIALWVHVDVTGWLGAIGVSCFVGGFLILVSRLGDGPDEWDDGAVV